MKLERYLERGGVRLRMGYTTGTCAAGASRAAADMLLGGGLVPRVRIHTPKGIPVDLDIEEVSRGEGAITCAVRKDGGDDPDATNGLLIVARVERMPEGIQVEGGEGVGRVTRPGLACPVGAAAINPVPRSMIHRELEEAARSNGYGGGLCSTISIPGGEEVAQRTHNPRLGIVGGLSILGTSGIVEPMSEAALLETIRLDLESRWAAGERTLLLTPGNYGRDFARERFGVALEEGVKCSNYIGESLDMAVARGFQRILLLGHAGKLVKLAAGIMNTHSRVADGRMEVLCAHCGMAGADREQLRRLLDCVTVDEADALMVQWGIADSAWRSVGERIALHLSRRVGGAVEVAFAAFAGRGILCQSPGAERFLRNGPVK